MIMNFINILVDVRLHEPLFKREDNPQDIELEIISLCAQLDLLCKKELREVLN